MKNHHRSTRTLLASAASSLVAMAAFATQSHAALLVYEPFDYTIGSAIHTRSGGTGFSGNWTRINADSTQDVGPGLSYGSLVSSGGALATNNTVGGSRRNITTITPANGATTWISFLFQATQTSVDGYGVSDTADFEAAPQTLGSGKAAPRFGAYYSSAESAMVFGIGATTGSPTLSDTTVTVGVTYLIVASILWDTTPGGTETISLFLNPSLAATPNPATALVTRTDLDIATNTDLNIIERIFVRNTATSSPDRPEWSFDEIRLGTSFADVTPVPEPASLALLLLGSALLAAHWFRKCRNRPQAG